MTTHLTRAWLAAVAFAALAGAAQANTITFDRKLTAPDGQQGDNFGYSVALDGTTALVGTSI